MFIVSEFTVDCIVLHCSVGTLDRECFNYELHYLVGAYVRLQPLDSKCQAGGGPIKVAHTLHIGCLGAGHTHTHTWRLGCILGTGHNPAHIWCLGHLPGGWTHPSTHVALGPF